MNIYQYYIKNIETMITLIIEKNNGMGQTYTEKKVNRAKLGHKEGVSFQKIFWIDYLVG